MIPESQGCLNNELVQPLAPAAPGYHVHHGLVVRVMDDAEPANLASTAGLVQVSLKAMSSLHVELSFLSSFVKALEASMDLSAFTT